MVYVYLDGDGIGRRIEAYIVNEDLEEVSTFSQRVTEAIQVLEAMLSAAGAHIIFSGGDNIFARILDDGVLFDELLKVFFAHTGATASAGVGHSPIQAFLGLALAKSLGGGRVIYRL